MKLVFFEQSVHIVHGKTFFPQGFPNVRLAVCHVVLFGKQLEDVVLDAFGQGDVTARPFWVCISSKYGFNSPHQENEFRFARILVLLVERHFFRISIAVKLEHESSRFAEGRGHVSENDRFRGRLIDGNLSEYLNPNGQ